MKQMYINDKKIISAIERNLEKGRFVIFPYGAHGKRVKYLLNKKYKIQELAIVDNKLSGSSEDILNINDIQQIDAEDYVVLFAVSNPEVYSELLEQSKCFHENSVCDIAAVEVNDFFSMCSDKLNIEKCNNEQMETIFNLTKKTWTQLGSSEPYWSVLTDKKYLQENINRQSREKEFYETGRKSCQAVIKTLIRNNVIREPEDAKHLEITEIGCGTGRVTKHLAQAFGKVTAVDISPGNIEIASSVLQNEKNVSFCLYRGIEDYMELPKSDVVYSIMVLQHNIPSVIEYMLNAMFQSIKEGGTIYFQVPTYKEAYEFKFDEYMKDLCIGKMEMHLLVQKRIFELAYENGCIPMEVWQDDSCARDNFSCTFVMKKMRQ